MRFLPAAAGLLVLAACQIGTSAKNYAPARGPAGATVDLRLSDKSRIIGELLAVEENDLLVLRDSNLIRIPLSRIRIGSAPKLRFEGMPSRDRLERLRLISRYPQGVSSELESRLLRTYGQSEVTSPS